jgi:hypothetical protein
LLFHNRGKTLKKRGNCGAIKADRLFGFLTAANVVGVYAERSRSAVAKKIVRRAGKLVLKRKVMI